MPKAMRCPEEIQVIRDQILDTAATIIYEQGFDNLSMRKIASRLGMTAANIYNYYANRDELYLSIQIKGFTLFNDHIQKVYDSCNEPVERLRQLIIAYIDFGISNPGFYEIMLDSNTPRYKDYIGTRMEPLAYEDKQLALDLFGKARRALAEIAETTGLFPKEDVFYRAFQLWTSVHGIITLLNRKIMYEVVEEPMPLIQKMADDLAKQFSR